MNMNREDIGPVLFFAMMFGVVALAIIVWGLVAIFNPIALGI
jgi:hypothetical protein